MVVHNSGLRTVVVGVDFTMDSEAVVKWVGQRLPAEGTTVLVHALDLPRHADETSAQKEIKVEAAASARESLERLRSEFMADRDVELVVEPGEPMPVLSTLALERDADLIVVGPHQGHPALEKFVGSTGQRLMHESVVPVLLAVGTGGSEGSEGSDAAESAGV